MLKTQTTEKGFKVATLIDFVSWISEYVLPEGIYSYAKLAEWAAGEGYIHEEYMDDWAVNNGYVKREEKE